MLERLFLAAVGLLVGLMLVPTLRMRTWIESHGVPNKHYGLLKVEVIGCSTEEKVLQGVTDVAKWGMDVDASKALSCSRLTGGEKNAVMSWHDYELRACFDATADACRSLSFLDPMDTCKMLLARCASLRKLMQVNVLVVFMTCGGVGCSLAAGALPYISDGKWNVVGVSALGFILLLSGVMYYASTTGEYNEPSPMHVVHLVRFGMAFYIACFSCALALLQVVAAITILKTDETVDDEEAEGFAVKECQRVQMQDYGAQHQGSPPAGNSDQHMNMILQAIQMQGCSDLAGAFRGFDMNGDGLITQEEFCQGLVKLGLNLAEGHVGSLLASLDQNLDGYVDYYEFVARVQRLQP